MFQEMKGLTPKKKIEHYITYYGLATVAIIAVIAFVASWIYSAVTAKEEVADILILNGADTVDEDSVNDYFDQIMADHDCDTKKQEIGLTTGVYVGDNYDSQTSYYGLQKMQTLLMAYSVDVVLFDDSYSENLISMGAFDDLSTILTEEELASFGDDVLYYTDDETGETYPVAVPADPDSTLLSTGGWYDGTTAYIGVCFRRLSEDASITNQILTEAIGVD